MHRTNYFVCSKSSFDLVVWKKCKLGDYSFHSLMHCMGQRISRYPLILWVYIGFEETLSDLEHWLPIVTDAKTFGMVESKL